jgi:hypothetical protein
MNSTIPDSLLLPSHSILVLHNMKYESYLFVFGNFVCPPPGPIFHKAHNRVMMLTVQSEVSKCSAHSATKLLNIFPYKIKFIQQLVPVEWEVRSWYCM